MTNSEAYMVFWKYLEGSIDEINSMRVYNLALRQLLEGYPDNNGQAIASIYDIDFLEPPESNDINILYCSGLDKKLQDLSYENYCLEKQVKSLEGVKYVSKRQDDEKVILKALDKTDLDMLNFPALLEKAARMGGDNNEEIFKIAGDLLEEEIDKFAISEVD